MLEAKLYCIIVNLLFIRSVSLNGVDLAKSSQLTASARLREALGRPPASPNQRSLTAQARPGPVDGTMRRHTQPEQC